MRVNARLDEMRARKLEFLMEEQQSGVTEVIKSAIDMAYASRRQKTRKKRPILDSLVGVAEGSRDLSTRSKKYLIDYLKKKHGYR